MKKIVIIAVLAIAGISYVIYDVNKANEDFAKPTETLTKVLEESSRRPDTLINAKK